MIEKLFDLKIIQQKKKIIIVVIASLAAIYIDFSLILKSQLKSLKSVSSGVRQMRLDFVQYKKDSSALQNLLATLKSLQERRAAGEVKIISDSDIPDLLDDISQKANSYNIKIMQIKPIRLDAEKDKIQVTVSGGDPQFYAMPLTLQLRCGYHNLGEFLGDLESNPLIEAASLKIRYDDSSPRYHNVDLKLKAYVTKK